MPVGGLVRSIRKHNKTFWPLPRKTKKGMTPLNVLLKTGYPPPPHSSPPPKEKYVCKNKNSKRKVRLLSVWTSTHRYMELILFIPSDILCSLSISCAGTIINRQGIYHKRFFGFRKRSIILESSGIFRNGRGANALNAWKGANDGSCKDRWHAGFFNFFFFVSEKPSESLFFIPE